MPRRSHPRPSHEGRLYLAMVLVVSYYLFVGIVALLLASVPYWYHRATGRIRIDLLLGGPLSALILLVVGFPVRKPFEPPGPRIQTGQHPRLFEELRLIAKSVGEAPVQEVYLSPEMNAGVLEKARGGGAGRRKILVLGLPLLAVVRVSELRAILAHEYGHFSHGDTRLAARVFAIRDGLQEAANVFQESAVRWLFVTYAKAFLRATLAASRSHELEADALAASVAGAEALSRGLRAITAASASYPAFVGGVYLPLLKNGIGTPFIGGYRTFRTTPWIADAEQAAVDAAMNGKATSPYDSHPPLGERCDAIGILDPAPADSTDPPALDLLEDPEGLEPYTFIGLLRSPAIGKMAWLEWDQVPMKAYLPGWRASAARHGAWLRGTRVADLGDVIRTRRAPARKGSADARRTERGFDVAAAALIVTLVDSGWSISAPPGAPVRVFSGERSILPFEVCTSLGSGEMGPDGWRAMATALGIGNLTLDPGGATS